ncbi:MAG: hypothetical protein ACXWO1_19760, partial [Isosphaeraceae bacterium]
MSAVAQRAKSWLNVHSTPIFAEAQFAFSALIFLSGQAGFSTVLTASALSITLAPKKLIRTRRASE